jgi:dihydrolipoamide dehydrogenase
MGATVKDLPMTIHPYLTLGEVIMEAAENAGSKMMMKRKKYSKFNNI